MALHHNFLSLLIVLSLGFFTLFADAVRLIRENGFKPNTYYYHLGDGGHAYHINSETASSVYFKCVLYERGCHGRAILRIGGRFRHSNPHNHPPDPDFVGERHFRENVLNHVSNARFVSFQDVLNDFRRDRRYSRRVRARMNLRRLHASMSRRRIQRYPAIPETLRDLTRILLGNAGFSKTVDELEDLYAGSITAADGSHHVAFFSPRMLQFLGNLKLIQADGTFKARPALPPSRQCFVLVTTWRHSVVPIGWFLMESKSLEAYRAVFRLLKQICPNFDPEVIITDWEYAQQQAWHEAFPNAELQGCLWHLARAFIRKARKRRLIRFHKILPSLLTYINKAINIALLPPDLFEDALEILRDQSFEDDVVLWHLLTPFFDYVQERWISNNARKEWMSCFNSEHRTNNSCETHNRMLRKKVGAYRPNVFLFIEALATLEDNANLDIYHMADGGQSRRARRWQSVLRDRQIKALNNDLEMDIFHDLRETISQFLSRASDISYGVVRDLIREDRQN